MSSPSGASAPHAAGQIATRTGSNPAYAWTAQGLGTTNTSVDGRNFLTSVGGVAATQDARGNLLSSPSGGSSAPVFSYTAENRLASGPGSNLYYDPLGRLRHVSGSGTDFVYDGGQVLQELGAYGMGNRRGWVPGRDERGCSGGRRRCARSCIQFRAEALRALNRG